MKTYRLIALAGILAVALCASMLAAAPLSRPQPVQNAPEYIAGFPAVVTGITHTAPTCQNVPYKKPFRIIPVAEVIFWVGAVGTTPTMTGASAVGMLLPAKTASPVMCSPGIGKNRLCILKSAGASATTYVYMERLDSYPGCVT